MKTDQFYPIQLEHLLRMILKQLDENNQIFGIPKKLFYSPELVESFRSERFGQLLETPIGVAAGPHTQLAQNIIAAWICGARFIELKTVQTLDELEISKPCIDMQDEGYNCEWSQELKIHESFDQYLDAWIIIHILKHKLGIGSPSSPGVIFNMSVGYNMEGILKDNVQWFFSKMADASAELEEKIKSIEKIYPEVREIEISPRLSDNITLSTMHGCPPDEIEKIGHYLLSEKKLHTAIKLNPTLIGKEKLREILLKSGFETNVPDIAFEHDLKYPDALSIIKNLQETASKNKLQLSIKLTNTLESVNHKDVFSADQEMMYMSGRALHPISVNLAAKLQKDFNGELDISFCGGVHAFNVSDVVACGMSPVTVSTDILKPGGYTRLNQYIEELRKKFKVVRANSIDDFIQKKCRTTKENLPQCLQVNLNHYAQVVLGTLDYKKTSIHDTTIKTNRPLGMFDCIHAPCVDTCPTNQDIPNYNYYTLNGDICKAGEIILQTNPFPQTTGMICDHLCQTKCTRINYDGAVLIREIKRYVAETAIASQSSKPREPKNSSQRKRVAIIGAGPSGLSCAYFLAQAGFRVEVFESKPNPGGMVSGVIPSFRLTNKAISNDIQRVRELGVEVNFDVKINVQLFKKLQEENCYVYIAAGAQNSAKLEIAGISSSAGVVDPLKLLEDVKKGNTADYGKRIAIIGGGNTAMDVARTAFRLVGNDGKVTIIYRRTIKEMPADQGEIIAVLKEGVAVMELTSPDKILSTDGRVSAILCSRMELGEKDESGRRRPIKIPNSEFEVEVDTVIPAVGQELAFDFGNGELICSEPGKYETKIPNVFIGGDALRGASTAINAIGDGRKVAQLIIDREGIDFKTRPENIREPMDSSWHIAKRSRKVNPVKVLETSLSDRKNFELVTQTLTEDEVIDEASRCLLCDEYCSICATVCPNMANVTYNVKPTSILLQTAKRKDEGSFAIEPSGLFEVKQPYQILNIANFCNECGNCNTFCPSSGAPYKEKPKIFLTQSSFNDAEEGFYLDRTDEHEILYFKNKGDVSSFCEKNGSVEFMNQSARVILSSNSLNIVDIQFMDSECTEFSTYNAAVMSVILEGCKQLTFS
ncbi:MAG TPA: putative selenate reductase subunit YgfK [Tenuifilaceae bacterium]|nr:putative selenate reductase subunit YgfK [Tenuifilaceae bacterium]